MLAYIGWQLEAKGHGVFSRFSEEETIFPPQVFSFETDAQQFNMATTRCAWLFAAAPIIPRKAVKRQAMSSEAALASWPRGEQGSTRDD